MVVGFRCREKRSSYAIRPNAQHACADGFWICRQSIAFLHAQRLQLICFSVSGLARRTPPLLPVCCCRPVTFQSPAIELLRAPIPRLFWSGRTEPPLRMFRFFWSLSVSRHGWLLPTPGSTEPNVFERQPCNAGHCPCSVFGAFRETFDGHSQRLLAAFPLPCLCFFRSFSGV